VVDLPSRNERRDVLDQAWAPFLADCGIEMVAVPNRHPDPAAYLKRLGASGVILTGGGNISPSLGTRDGRPAQLPASATDLAPERDVTETALLRASIAEGWPVLGVCRGMQAMNLFHGGSVAPLAGHSGSRHSITPRQPGGVPTFDLDLSVNSYHDFGVPPDGVGEGLVVLADAEGWPEMFVHTGLRHLGIMWHPERNRPAAASDIALFNRFFTTGSN
jgi:putative glutamine amidotransferase